LNFSTVHNNITKIEKELSVLEAELEKVVYLLKVADPMVEGAHERGLKPSEANPRAPNDNPRAEAKKEENLSKMSYQGCKPLEN
jgi:hypothetical protein